MWDLRSTWRSTEIDPELSPISHVIRWSDEFRRPRKPRNINDVVSKFERVAGELRAKLRWGAVFTEVSRCHRSWSSSKLAGHKQPGLLRTTLSKQTVRKSQTPPGRHQSYWPSSRLSAVMVMGSGHGYRYRSGISGRGTLRDGGHDIRMITILIHIHVRST